MCGEKQVCLRPSPPSHLCTEETEEFHLKAWLRASLETRSSRRKGFFRFFSCFRVRLQELIESQAKKAFDFDCVQSRVLFLEKETRELKHTICLQADQVRDLTAEKKEFLTRIDCLESEKRLLLQDKERLQTNVRSA